MAVIHLFPAGKPPLAFPDIALSLALFDNGHPPVEAKAYRRADHPFNGYPDQINPSKQYEPEASVLAFNIGQLYMGTAALGTSLIVCHNFYLSVCFYGICL